MLASRLSYGINLPNSSCVTLSKIVDLSVAWFLHHSSGNNIYISLHTTVVMRIKRKNNPFKLLGKNTIKLGIMILFF